MILNPEYLLSVCLITVASGHVANVMNNSSAYAVGTICQSPVSDLWYRATLEDDDSLLFMS